MEQAPEPEWFDAEVREPGLRRRREGLNLQASLWQGDALDCLAETHHHVCSYLGVLIHGTMGARTVDHFIPKSVRPDLAYEWANFRLACGRLNSRKSTHRDVLDPFAVADGWFVLDFDFDLCVHPNAQLAPPQAAAVDATVGRLRLNDDLCVRARRTFYEKWLAGEMSDGALEEWAPFVSREVARQGIRRGRVAVSIEDDPLA